MTDGALGFLDAVDPDVEAPVAAFEVLGAQQDAVDQRFRAGFDTPIDAFLGMHAAGAVALGYIDPEWYRDHVTVLNWWEFSAFLTDHESRAKYSDSPPGDALARELRERHVRRYLLPAFRDATAILRNRADEYTDDTSGRQPDDLARQRYLAMRPRLHQLAVGQHRALRRALGRPTDEQDAIVSRWDANRWAKQVVQQTAGTIGQEWLAAVRSEASQWEDWLTGSGTSAMLLFRLADDVVPAMMAALRDATERGSEQPSEPTERPEAFRT